MTEMYNGFAIETYNNPANFGPDPELMDELHAWEEAEGKNGEMDINSILREIKQYQTMESEIKEHLSGLKDKVRDFMKSKGVDTFYADQYKILYKEVISTRVDSELLKSNYPEVYRAVAVKSASKPLKII